MEYANRMLKGGIRMSEDCKRCAEIAQKGEKFIFEGETIFPWSAIERMMEQGFIPGRCKRIRHERCEQCDITPKKCIVLARPGATINAFYGKINSGVRGVTIEIGKHSVEIYTDEKGEKKINYNY